MRAQYLATHARGTVCAPDDHKTTPLHLAASGEGHAAVVHALLQHGASAAASDVEGQTPLHLAASRGTTEVGGAWCMEFCAASWLCA